MKLLKSNTILCIFLIFGVVLSASSAFGAATGFSDDAGGPMGLAIQGDAPGVKLAGVVFLELFNFHDIETNEGTVSAADGYAVVRLRKAQNIQTLYAEITDVPTADSADVQAAIAAVLEEQIIEKFFDGVDTVKLVLRTAEEFGEVDIYRNGDLSNPISYIITDIVIAGK